MTRTNEWMFGRQICHIHRPCVEFGGVLTQYVVNGSDTFRVKMVDKTLEVEAVAGGDGTCIWSPCRFTGELIWYVGGHVSVVARFEDGSLKDHGMWE